MTTYTKEQEALDNAAKDHDFFVEQFDGKNCHDLADNNCAGWDTEDRRCDCGNRRVSWTTDKDSHGMWYAYAEAY